MAPAHRVPMSVFGAGDRALVELDGREVALFRVDGAVHAFDNACPHAGNPLIEGDLRPGRLTCVYHLWEFDLETGACLAGDEPATRYRTEVVADEIVIHVDG